MDEGALKDLLFLDSAVPLPGAVLPVRSVVLQLSSGRVFLSPGSRLTAAQLTEAGAVTDLVAPSLFHAAGVPAAAAAHPGARLWGPEGIEQKHPALTWNILGRTPWPHDAELPVFALAGAPKLRDHVFFHRASRSLAVSDLVFNLLHVGGLGARIIFGLFGTFRRFAVSKLYLKQVTDRNAFEASLRPVLALDFRRLIPAHGDVVDVDARAKLAEALAERDLHAV